MCDLEQDVLHTTVPHPMTDRSFMEWAAAQAARYQAQAARDQARVQRDMTRVEQDVQRAKRDAERAQRDAARAEEDAKRAQRDARRATGRPSGAIMVNRLGGQTIIGAGPGAITQYIDGSGRSTTVMVSDTSVGSIGMIDGQLQIGGLGDAHEITEEIKFGEKGGVMTRRIHIGPKRTGRVPLAAESVAASVCSIDPSPGLAPAARPPPPALAPTPGASSGRHRTEDLRDLIEATKDDLVADDSKDEAVTCKICMACFKKIHFDCGHAFCGACAKRLLESGKCATCAQVIEGGSKFLLD